MSRDRLTEVERIELWLRDGGTCQRCGVKLEVTEFDADHIVPVVHGGTKHAGGYLENMQVLCRTCNASKGATMPKVQLREWQREAVTPVLKALHEHGQALVVAAPASGKTLFALEIVDRLGAFPVVLSPGTETQQNWRFRATSYHGRRLFNTKTFPSDVDGLSLTYSGMNAPTTTADLIRRTTRKPVLIILDEVHHLEQADSSDYEPGEWSRNVNRFHDRLTAFGTEVSVLSLSGTPWRTNGRGISFVTYDESGMARSAYEHPVTEAIAHGDIRPVQFHRQHGETEFTVAGIPQKYDLDGTDPNDAVESYVKRSLLQPGGEIVKHMLLRGIEALAAAGRPAGGLVICSDQAHAEQIAAKLTALAGPHGQTVVKATSNDEAATRTIDTFRKGKISSPDWLVTVLMVSEGVDIERLLVGVWLTHRSTRLFFQQAINRCTRTSHKHIPTDAHAEWVIPNCGPWAELAVELENAQIEAVQRRDDEQARDTGDRVCWTCGERFPCECPRRETLYQWAGDTAAGFSTVYRGQEIDMRAEQLHREYGIPLETAMLMARDGWSPPQWGAEAIGGFVEEREHVDFQPHQRLRDENKDAFRVHIKPELYRQLGDTNVTEMHKEANKYLNALVGQPAGVKHMTEDQLERRLNLMTDPMVVKDIVHHVKIKLGRW